MKRYLTLRKRVSASRRPFHSSMQSNYTRIAPPKEFVSKMTIEDLKDVLTFHKDDPQRNPPRALLWAAYEMPKSRFNPESDTYEHVSSQYRFTFLKKNLNHYFDFLKKHNLEKDAYDRFLRKDEEIRKTW